MCRRCNSPWCSFTLPGPSCLTMSHSVLKAHNFHEFKTISHPWANNLCMRKVLSFPVPYFHFPLQFLESQWSLLMFSYLNFTREMGERSAKIDSFAQAFIVAAELHSPAGVLDRLRRFISKTSRMRPDYNSKRKAYHHIYSSSLWTAGLTWRKRTDWQ